MSSLSRSGCSSGCEVAGEMATIAPAVFSATKLAVCRPMIEAARREAARTDAAVLENWCSPETLHLVSKFAEQALGRRV